MPNSTPPRGPERPFLAIVRGLCVVPCVLLVLVVSQPSLSAPTPLDSRVEKVLQALKEMGKLGPLSIDDKSKLLDARRLELLADIKKQVNQFTTINQLVSTVLLQEWYLATMFSNDMKFQMAIDDYHASLIKRLNGQLSIILSAPNPPLQCGVLGLLRAESEQIRNPGTTVERNATVTSILDGIAEEVIKTTQDPSDEVKIAAILALGTINTKPIETAEAFGKVLQGSGVEPRRSVTDAIQTIVTQIKKRVEKLAPKEQFKILHSYLAVLSKGLQDSDLLVRRRSGDLIVIIFRQLADRLRRVEPDPGTPVINADIKKTRDEWIQLLREGAPMINDLVRVLHSASSDPDPVVRALALASIEQMAALRMNLQGLPDKNSTQPGVPGNPPSPEPLPPPMTIRLYSAPVTLLRPVPSPTVRNVLVPVVYLGAPQLEQNPADQNNKEDENPRLPKPNTDPIPPGELFKPAMDTSLATLQRSLRDPNIRVRLFALDALELIGKDAAPLIPDLVNTLSDPDKFVRWSATRVLKGLAPHQAKQIVPALTLMLCEKDTGLRKAVMKSLAAFKKEASSALPDLIQELSRADVDVRAEAITVIIALEELGAPAIPALIENLSSLDNTVRQRAAEALGLLGPRAVAANQALYRLTRDDYPEVRRLASQALFRINPPPAMELKPEPEPQRDPRDR